MLTPYKSLLLKLGDNICCFFLQLSSMSACRGDDDVSLSTETAGEQCKGHKKSKVWRKVSWFSRRSKKPQTQTEHGDENPKPQFENLSRLWLGSSSSSESDLLDAARMYQGVGQRRTNCEIIEQHCLKPSATRVMFLRPQATSVLKSKSSLPRQRKFIWPKKRQMQSSAKESVVAQINSISRTYSAPDYISDQKTCHCLACCSCTTTERLDGLCPAYLQRCASTRSLDTALSELQYSLNRHDSESTDETFLDSSHEDCVKNQSEQQLAFAGSSKSSSSPVKGNYYSQSLQRKCKLCSKLIRQYHLPMNISARHPNLDNVATAVNYCDCKAVVKSCRLENTSHRDKLSATEYKAKADVSIISKLKQIKMV